MKPAVALTDKERFPLLRDHAFLNTLRQDACAPRFNFKSGDRLTPTHLEKVKAYAQRIRKEPSFWKENNLPDWMNAFMAHCVHTVPFYHSRTTDFAAQPTIRRHDIKNAPWLFASVETSLDDLLVYQTSGTTGPAMDVLFDPVSQACWLPQLQSILDRYSVHFSHDPRAVAVALICDQQSTLTYASLSTYLDGSGVLKINLNPAEWKDPDHRVIFLQKYDPEIITGDPFTFAALLALKPRIRPKAIVSSAMKLSSALRDALHAAFHCPVLDIYSLTECRMIACAEGDAHRAIRPDLYLEIFDPAKDVLLPYGERGELVVTGGNNPFLPLVRYRTGDHCSLEWREGIPYLCGLEARTAVAFYTRHGRFVNNVDISRALAHLPLIAYTLHQRKDYSLAFNGWSSAAGVSQRVQDVLHGIFGEGMECVLEIHPASPGPGVKVVPYSSEWE